MMDFTTGKTWVELNQLIYECFDHFIGIEENQFGIMYWLTDLVSGGETHWSGSIPENSFVHPDIRNSFEADVLRAVAHIPYDILQHALEDVPDEPGYCRILYNKALTDFLDDSQFEVKEINQERQSTLYIVPNPLFFDNRESISDAYSSMLPNNRPAHIIIQSLSDTFHLREFIESFHSTRHGPVMNVEVGVPFKVKGMEPPHPKKILYKFLENLSVRILDNLDSTTNTATVNNNHDHKKLVSQPTNVDLSFKLSMDICPAIQCSGWPIKAEAFFHRTRKWPDKALLQQIRKEGFHLVNKPLEPHSSKSVEWRISFSKAEYILLKNMDAFKIKCYRILKTIYYSELKMPDILCSYHLKNIFLWACERIPLEFWVESNLAQIIMGLLDDLLDCLATKTCRHFFIPENNLFAHVHKDFLDRMVALVSKIRRHPERLLLLIQQSANSNYSGSKDLDDNKACETTPDMDIELD